MAEDRAHLPKFGFGNSFTAYEHFCSDDFGSVIKGPVGSGKTVTSCLKILRHATEYPLDKLGYRRCRVGIIRQTYPELRSTTIRTWEDVFSGCHVPPVVYGAPISHRIRILPNDFKWLDIQSGAYEGSPGLDLEVWFIALERPQDVAHLKSLELSFVFINEGSEMHEDILDMLTARIGRFPKFKDMIAGTGTAFVGVIVDTNAADETAWTERYEGQAPPELKVTLPNGDEIKIGWSFFTQPPAVLRVEDDKIAEPGHHMHGRPVAANETVFAAGHYWCVNPEAENIENLRPGYYHSQLPNKTLEWIERYLQTKRIYLSKGRPWVPEFNQGTMIADIRFDPSLDILVGLDAGGGTLNPAAVWGQLGAFGDWRILSELVGEDIGFDDFLVLFKRHHALHYPDTPIKAVYVDPAARGRDQVYNQSILAYMRRERLPAILAPTNDIAVRRQAYARPMGRNIKLPDGRGAPGFLVDRSCPTLIAALAGKWYRKQVLRDRSQAIEETPVKLHPWSDVGDAGSYLLLGGGEYLRMGRDRGRALGSMRDAAEAHGGIIPVEVDIPVFGD